MVLFSPVRQSIYEKEISEKKNRLKTDVLGLWCLWCHRRITAVQRIIVMKWTNLNQIVMVLHPWRSARWVECRAPCLEGVHPKLLSAVTLSQW